MRLEAKGIDFGYSANVQIIAGLGFALESGEKVALVGPSGSGKSTFAAMLSGYLRPWHGEVTLDGSPLPKRGYCPVQLVYQHPEKALNPRRRLGDSLGDVYGNFGAADFEGSCPQLMGIEREWLSRYPSELSGGELQRFCIARALGPKTRFLVADEMTAMMDAVTQAQIWEATLAMVDREKLGLVAITHNMDLAKAICDRTVRIDEINGILGKPGQAEMVV